MKKVAFLLAAHNHQPVGNFDHVFEDAAQKSYLPFARMMLEHPKIHWSLHCTGILWQWMQKHHPEYLELIKTMTDRGQLELISGGYYEPIFSIIPDKDKQGQVQKLNDFLLKNFNVTPKGMWCAERVWETHLPQAIKDCGIDYTILDDTHFLSAGLAPEELFGYFSAQEQNASIDTFPISQKLRYTIPFACVQETIDLLRQAAQTSTLELPCMVMADDGEKFGFWPQTFDSVYTQGWLKEFLTALEENADWIQTMTFSSYRATQSAAGSVYLPGASYFEMSEWSLPNAQSTSKFEHLTHFLQDHLPESERYKPFLRGGIWRNFLIKYSESNILYQKMLRVSQRIENLSSQFKKTSDFKKAQDHLWAGQCNCPYWHGVFGGLYLPFLRRAVHQNLIDAEIVLDKLENKKLTLTQTDFDHDGKMEILAENAAQNIYISPAQGGSIVLWDSKLARHNISNVLTRRQEAYHEKLKQFSAQTQVAQSGQSIHDIVRVKEPGLDKILQYDWHKRLNAQDHFLSNIITQEDFKSAQYKDAGDFVLNSYASNIKNNSIELERLGKVELNEQKFSILVQKTVTFYADYFTLHYRIQNKSDAILNQVFFAPEFNFSAAMFDEKQDVSWQNNKNWNRQDPHWNWQILIDFSQNCEGWVTPLETVSNSENGYERSFQGITVLPRWLLNLQANQIFEVTLNFKVSIYEPS